MTEFELINHIKETTGADSNDLLSALTHESIYLICADKQTVQDAIDLITNIENLFGE